MSSNTQQSSSEICKLIIIWGYKSIRGSTLSKHAWSLNLLWNQVTPAKVVSAWWTHLPWWDFMSEQSSPDPRAELLSSISALYPLGLLAVKLVHLESGQHRQATKVVQGNRKAWVHLTHSKVSYSPSLLSIGGSGSCGAFPSQEYSWASKGKATCCTGYLGLNEES